MSIIPLLFNQYSRPSRILDQHFGLGLDWDDLLEPVTALHYTGRHHPLSHYRRPWTTVASRKDTGSTITADKDKFQINLDVQQFAPEEITVKVSDKNTITVEAKHEEKQDEHGFISRHFVRRYVLPDGHNINNLVSNLSSDGVLSISAPRIEKGIEQERTIPIQQTGVPSKPIESKKAATDKETKM